MPHTTQQINNKFYFPSRLEITEGIRNNLIISSYCNFDLTSLKSLYQYIKQHNKQKKTIVLSSFSVVGEECSIFYQKIAELTNEQGFDQIFLIGNEITKHQNLFSGNSLAFHNIEELFESKVLNNIENQIVILISGLEKIKKTLELHKHDTVLEINLNAILHNIHTHKALLNPSTKICAMVKAFSYGLASYQVAEFLQHHNIDYLGVAYTDEGVDLRKNGITKPIMVMNPGQDSYSNIIDYNLEPEIYSLRTLELFGNQLKARNIQKPYPIHIKIETGMHRLGFKEAEIDDLMQNLHKYNIKVVSIFSHLSSADVEGENEYTLSQINTFDRISNKIIENLGYQPIRHILNSAGTVNYTDYQYDMVRLGIGMVGISANENVQHKLKNVVKLKSIISQISDVKAGESVGYSRKYRTEKDTKIATIPIGYADGIPRLVGNQQGFVWVNNQKLPIVSNVCMDMLMVDLGDTPAKEGDEVVLFNSISDLKDFSEYCKTIPYEVLTSISQRVKRVYIKD